MNTAKLKNRINRRDGKIKKRKYGMRVTGSSVKTIAKVIVKRGNK